MCLVGGIVLTGMGAGLDIEFKTLVSVFCPPLLPGSAIE